MLYQGRDDNTWVILTKNINTIRVFFGREGDLPSGGAVDTDVMALRDANKVAVEDSEAGAAKRTDSDDRTNSLQVPGSETNRDSDSKPPEDKRKTRLSNKNLKSSFR